MHCSSYCSWWPHQILTVTLDFDPAFVQGHIIQFLLVTCLWNMFSFSQLLNLVMFIQIFTRLLKINAVDSEDVSFFAEFIRTISYDHVFWS